MEVGLFYVVYLTITSFLGMGYYIEIYNSTIGRLPLQTILIFWVPAVIINIISCFIGLIIFIKTKNFFVPFVVLLLPFILVVFVLGVANGK